VSLQYISGKNQRYQKELDREKAENGCFMGKYGEVGLNKNKRREKKS
jgi:hypothetical protein